MRVQKTVTLSEEVIEKVEKYPLVDTDNFSARLVRHAEDFQSMIYWAKRELEDFFTFEEASLIANAFNGARIESLRQPADVLLNEIKDACRYHSLDERHNVDKLKLLAKLETLSSFQSFIVIYNAFEFWSAKSRGMSVEEINTKLCQAFLIPEVKGPAPKQIVVLETQRVIDELVRRAQGYPLTKIHLMINVENGIGGPRILPAGFKSDAKIYDNYIFIPMEHFVDDNGLESMGSYADDLEAEAESQGYDSIEDMSEDELDDFEEERLERIQEAFKRALRSEIEFEGQVYSVKYEG